jgi:cytochrome b subunit of formate dehydrogenase
MCDHASFSKLREDVEAIKNDIDEMKEENAAHCAASEERFKLIFGFGKWVISFLLAITGIMLLTIIYGAIGDRGLHSVAHEFNEIVK